jgi:hypothetical protein
MSIVKEIESAVRELTRDELTTFRDWFQTFDADAWDRQLEEDVSKGKLDQLAEEALGDLRDGHCTQL